MANLLKRKVNAVLGRTLLNHFKARAAFQQEISRIDPQQLVFVDETWLNLGMRELKPVLKVFEFRVSRYYASLIDWKDPDDPLRRIVMPDVSELDSMLDIDASDEEPTTARARPSAQISALFRGGQATERVF
jgi:L-lysine 2,3-aminomutase